MNSQKIMYDLMKEQKYAIDLADKLGVPYSLKIHEVPTQTCKDKAELLNWPLERMVKTIYFKNKEHVVGVVTPEYGTQINVKDIFPQIFEGVSKKKAKGYTTSYLPKGMTYGTCTPFFCEDEDNIDAILVKHSPALDKELVDISIGGTKTEDMKKSMHIEYSGIYKILKEKFGDKVKLY